MIKYLIFDTETNGLPAKGNDFSLISMLELGYIILDENFEIIKESNNLIKGIFDVPEIITKLTGITKEITDNEGNDINIVLKDFIYDIRNVDYILAHNNRFDLGILKKELVVNDSKYYFDELICKKINLDTIQIFKKHIPKNTIDNYKLQTVFNHLNPDTEFIQTHRAIDDCHMLHKSLSHMKRQNNFCLNEYFFNKPITFGKYKKSQLNLKSIYNNDRNYFKFIFNKIYKVNYVKFLKFL